MAQKPATKRKTLMHFLGTIGDPRTPSNGMLHDFEEILVISVCAMISGAESFEDIALWGRVKQEWLKRFLVLKNGIPSHDTFDRIFRILDPKKFEQTFRRWTRHVVTALGGQIAIDGKTLRGSADDGPPVHMVSAFATDVGIALGQEKVADKSNEITAIPVLLEALSLKGMLVSSDAMGCQKQIAATITAMGGDYLLAVKGNQASLLSNLEAALAGPIDTPVFKNLITGHGRVVAQFARTLPADGIVDTARWSGCASIGRIDTLRVVNGKPSDLEQRYYISSRQLTAEELARAARAHWAIENQLHWVLDVTFGEDASQIRKDNAAQNFSLLKKIVLTILRTDTTDSAKTSLRQKIKRAGWDDDLRMGMLGIQERTLS
jgi:predicted transposase YbfD/YdcC